MLDIIQFLEDHHIGYTTRSNNISRGEVAIKCPFCGQQDPSEHMAINLTKGYWCCRRNPQEHSGRRLHRLIQKLLNCTYAEADDIAMGERDLTTFNSAIQKLIKKPQEPVVEPELRLPKEFKPLSSRGSGVYYTDYLERRGFLKSDLPQIIKDYDLRYCTTGIWRGRIIFPLRFETRLVCWTGRTISKTAIPRYRTLGNQSDGSQRALLTPKDIVFNFDSLRSGGKTLLVVEGPIDALKTDVYGKAGVRSTCLFGTGISYDQVVLITSLMERFNSLFILGDVKAESNVNLLTRELARLRPGILQLPSGVDDPGDLTKQQVEKLTKNL